MPYQQPYPTDITPERCIELGILARGSWSNPDERTLVETGLTDPQERLYFQYYCRDNQDDRAHRMQLLVDGRFENLVVNKAAQRREQEAEAQQRGHVSSRILTYAQLRELTPPSPLVENVAYTGAVGLLLGDSQTGKTWVMLSIAAAAAVGMPWPAGVARGLQPIPVLYIAAEDGGSIGTRLIKWEHAHNKALDDYRFDVHPSAVNVLDAVQVDELCEVIIERGYRLIVVDTVAASLAGEEEGNAEFSRMISHMRRLVAATQGQGAVFLVHHFGKDKTKGARGGSSLFNDADIVWGLYGDLDSMEMRCEKWKTDAVRDTWRLRLDRSDPEAIHIALAKAGSYSVSSGAPEDKYKVLTAKILGIVKERAAENQGFGPSRNVIKASLRQMKAEFRDVELTPQLDLLVSDRQLYVENGSNRAQFYRLPPTQEAMDLSGDSR